MSKPLIDRELLQRFADAVAKNNGKITSTLCDDFGISSSAAYRWKFQAIRRGIIGSITENVPDGFEIHAVTRKEDESGRLIEQSIRMGDPKGEAFQIPAGQRIKGVSALVDSDGLEKIKWVKTEHDRPTPEECAKVIRKAFENFQAIRPTIRKPDTIDEHTLVVYPILDWHLGMFAWGAETGGPDWDLSIAKKVLVQNFQELVQSSPRGSKAVALCLGDMLHADNSENRTRRSGNPLDVDTRYDKVLTTAAEILMNCIEILTAHHCDVEVAMKRGNHDDESTKALRLAMTLAYRDNPRVMMENDQNPDFYYRRFGVNLIGGTHGDLVKLDKLPIVMANHCPKEWSVTSTRHYFTGHVHHFNSKEDGGVTAWTLRAPIPQDAYHSSKAYLSGRSLYAFKYHRDLGSRGHNELEIVHHG